MSRVFWAIPSQKALNQPNLYLNTHFHIVTSNDFAILGFGLPSTAVLFNRNRAASGVLISETAWTGEL